MSRTRPYIFISYCWDNSDEYYFLEYLKNSIEERFHNNVDIFLDRQSTNVNDNYSEHEKNIKIADLILVFFTPEYKKALTSTEKRRLKKEYPLIVKQQNDINRRNCVYPILFKGNETSSVPEEFVEHHCFPFSSKIFYDKVGGRPKFSNRKNFQDFVYEIANEARENFENMPKEWDREDEHENQLLYNTKADNMLPKKCMLEVDAYEEVFKQNVFIVVGRKGSGKTTLLEIIRKLNVNEYKKKYKTLSPVKMDDINITRLFKLLETYRRDLDILQDTDIINVYWQLFFILQCIYVIALEEERGIIPQSDSRKNIFKSVTKLLKNRCGNFESVEDESLRKGISNLTIELIENHLHEGALKFSNDVNLLTSYVNNINANLIIKQFLGKNFKSYVNALKQCKKKILICLDGFDVTSEDFRIRTVRLKKKDKDEFEKRTHFEELYYRGLMLTVDKFKMDTFGNAIDVFRSCMDFCILLPQDRIDQMHNIDRDRAKRRLSYLNWDAYELFEMLAKRLEYVYKVTPPDNLNPKERVKYVLAQKACKLPSHIEVTINGNTYNFEILNYILRQTFWRPREIILHIARLIKIHKRAEKLTIPISHKTIKSELTGSAEKIISDELYFEYKHVFYNLSDILSEFANSKILWNVSEFIERIAKCEFETVLAKDNGTIESKISILYQLGIIGLYFEKNDLKSSGYECNILFVFNEGLDPIESLINTKNYTTTKAKIIFNPIFSKKLALEYNISEPIGDFSWEYIQSNHLRKDSIRRT
ncbi:hypothetical protein IJD15_02405 [bacterium]|nr:hypothetical protein [Clostridia bacterium]MBQ4078015.1 hypothetical protein [bacterium]